MVIILLLNVPDRPDRPDHGFQGRQAHVKPLAEGAWGRAGRGEPSHHGQSCPLDMTTSFICPSRCTP